MNDELIITGSFNRLLDRVAKIDFFDVWLTGTKILKKAKKDRIEATVRVSEVLTLTGLTWEDIEFFVSLGLISVIAPGEDPVLSFKDVSCLVNIFERFVDDEVISDVSLRMD